MLKKTLLASLITVSAVASVQAATVYDKDGNNFKVGGRVEAGFKSVVANDGDNAAIKGKARLNIGGQSVITEGVKAIAFAEWNVASSTSEDGTFATRYATVGFDTDNYGSLVFGQTDTALYNVVAKTDVFEEWGSEANTYWDLADNLSSGGRQEGQAVYQYRNGGFSFGASYQTAFDIVKSGGAVAAGYGFDVVDNLPIDFQVGYDFYELEDGYDDYDSYAASVSLGSLDEGIYSAFLYQFSELNRNAAYNSYEFVLGYTYDKATFIAGYEVRDLAADNEEAEINKLIALARYQFTDNFLAFTEAEFGLGGSKTNSKNDKLTVSVRYSF